MEPFRLYAATGDAVAQLDSRNGDTVIASLTLEGRDVMSHVPHGISPDHRLGSSWSRIIEDRA